MVIDCIFAFCYSYLQREVKPCLLKLKSDPDLDVQYYALEALEGNPTQFPAVPTQILAAPTQFYFYSQRFVIDFLNAPYEWNFPL